MKLQSLVFLACNTALFLPAGAQIFTSLATGRSTDTIVLKADTFVTYTSRSGSLEDHQRIDSPLTLATTGVIGTYEAMVSSRVDPTSITVKDYGSAQVRFSYLNGGVSADLLTIQLDVHGSALTAQVGNPLKPADLDIRAALGYGLGGDPAGGTLRLGIPSLPLVGPMESLFAELEGGGNGADYISPRHFTAGSSATTVDLDARGNYVFVIAYSLHVPFGTDPDFNYAFGGGTLGLAAVPEPEGWAVVLGAGCGLWALGRRVRR